ncbi:MAG: glycosyltransferase [bacterium]|nr:glycosyltransferase [bacterium]
MAVFLSVIMPAYNEEKNLKRGVLEEVWEYLSKQKYTWEVLIVDDGSTDKTIKLVENFIKKGRGGFKLIKEKHRGKGGTVIAGMLHAQGDYTLFCDMDQATPIFEIEKFLPKFKEGYDVVIASRSGREGAPIIRKLMAYGFILLRTIILRLPYKDTQCGFKAFKMDSAGKIFKRLKVFSESNIISGASVSAGFDLEILYIARKLGLKVAEVNVTWSHKDTERINPIRDSFEGLRDLFRVRINALLGKYRST